MNNFVYYHQRPGSAQSKLIQSTMRLLRMNQKMEKKILNDRFSKEVARIPGRILKKYDVMTIEQEGRKIWQIAAKNRESDLIILYLHGGAYYANILVHHWLLIEQLLLKTTARVIVPDYPLAPQAQCLETYQFMETLYMRLIGLFPNKHMVFMGDSAGGGLALGLAQMFKNKAIKQPKEIVLFSPWLDASMHNPDIAEFANKDKILSVNGLKVAGKKYAGDLNVTDYRISPIYGDYTGLGCVSIFIGTNDLLIADARKCRLLLEEKGINYNYFEYPEMFHDWVIITRLKESRDVINRVGKILNDRARQS